VSHLAVGAYEAPLGAGPPASILNQVAGPGIDPGIPALSKPVGHRGTLWVHLQ
jgi:hypothetical protein